VIDVGKGPFSFVDALLTFSPCRLLSSSLFFAVRLRSGAPPSYTFGAVRFRSLRRSGGISTQIRAKRRRFYTQLAALRKYSMIGGSEVVGAIKKRARQGLLDIPIMAESALEAFSPTQPSTSPSGIVQMQ
jgi:hypothetical protein